MARLPKFFFLYHYQSLLNQDISQSCLIDGVKHSCCTFNWLYFTQKLLLVTQTSNLYPSVLQYLCTFNHLNLFLSVAFFLSRCNSALKAGHLGPVMCVFLKKHTSQTLCVLCPFSQLCTMASYLSFYSVLWPECFSVKGNTNLYEFLFLWSFPAWSCLLEKRKNKNTFFPHFQIII